MNKLFLISCLTLLLTGIAGAQSLRLKSNSVSVFKVTAIGVSKDGTRITKTLNDVGLGFWKTISLYKTKYGYDLYNNKEMKSDGADATNRWQSLILYNEAIGKSDTLDITSHTEEKRLRNCHIWARVRQTYDNDYLMTYVLLCDERK